MIIIIIGNLKEVGNMISILVVSVQFVFVDKTKEGVCSGLAPRYR